MPRRPAPPTVTGSMIRPNPGSFPRLTLGGFVSLALALGCAPPSPSPSPRERTAESVSALSVQEAADASCVTTSVEPLSMQIVAQSNCNAPGAFTKVPERPNVAFEDTVFPYMQEPARDAFLAAADSAPDTSMQVNSMLRTVAQQYLLYSWYQKGTCGIALASTPGKSPHESGLAIDIEEHALWQPALEAQGFQWQGSGDPVHFTYVGAGVVDNQGIDVLAFQQLWNLNHPADLLDEDGLYGPQTEARLTQSPAEGFAVGASCAPGTGGAGGSSSGAGAASGTGGGGQGGDATGSGGDGAGGSSSGGNGGTGGSSSESQTGCSCGTAPGDPPLQPGPAAALLLALGAAAASTRRSKRPRPPLLSP